MLSNIMEIPGANRVVLHFVNYSDFPVENVTVHVLGSYKSAVLSRPDGPEVAVAGYPVEDGTGFDIESLGTLGTLTLTR
jgi:hypothetical protein